MPECGQNRSTFGRFFEPFSGGGVASPTTRVLALLELLQANHRLGGHELAERLGVDPRTVRRYAGRLQELGLPVVAERGRYGGYRLLPGYKLPPLMLSDDEAVAVVLGLLAAERLGLATATPAAGTALVKLQRVLPVALRERTQALAQTLDFTQRPRPSLAPATAVLLTLGQATRARERIRMRYRSWRGERSERELDPYGLVFHAGRWYVAGHDHRRGQVRTFRLDRIEAAEPVGTSFEVPDGFDAAAHVTHSLARVPYRWEVEVLVEADLAELRPRIPPTAGTLTPAEGGVLLRTRAERLDGMARLLAGLGRPFVVHRPDRLRTELLALAGRLAALATRRR
jgi:predicted DNA-binding transcriptional regulator YafY